MLVERIEQFYTRTEDSRPRNYFNVSEAGDCFRKIFFKITGVPAAPLEPRVQRIFHEGEHVHMRLMSALYSLGMVTASEVKIPETELFHGRADAIVRLDNENYVVELKSISPFGFEKLDVPKPEHMKQIQLYMHYFNMPKGIILLENKANQEIREFIVTKNDAIVSKIMADFAKLKEMISNKQVPTIPDKTTWEYDMCAYCAYKEHCDKVAKNQANN